MYGVSVWVCSWVPSKVCVGVVWRKAEKKENLKRWQVSDIKIIESIIPGDVGVSVSPGSFWRAAPADRGRRKQSGTEDSGCLSGLGL